MNCSTNACEVIGASVDTMHVTVPPDNEQPAGALEATNVVPAGTGTDTITAFAVDGPAFAAVTV